jgi:hypothetical protein
MSAALATPLLNSNGIVSAAINVFIFMSCPSKVVIIAIMPRILL